MQFIPRGPDIPNNLLFAHEEGRVVFFCGAGISMGRQANLPNFKDLVKFLFEECGNASAWESREGALLDQSLTWLENTVSGGRKEIIGHVYDILNPSRLSQVKSPIHQALLTLSHSRKYNATMLVTTNFDRLFEQCLQNDPDRPQAFIAPHPPIPKPSYWDRGGIVYLHGLIPEYSSNNTHKDNLILTDGDFGRAYLTDGWATRFVIELFRNYVVCFVGYSLNDPVMRHLSNALAYDGKDGISLPERYIFLPKSEKNESDYPGLTVIPYTKTEDHYFLHETFKAWANDYSNENIREEIIQNFINLDRADLSHTNEFRNVPAIDRFMWALCDQDAAKHFATMYPRPTWELINVLTAKEFDFEELISFGHPNFSTRKPSNFQRFSLLEPVIKSEDMHYLTISDNGFDLAEKSDISSVLYFYQWIARHVDKPETALWVLQKDGRLNVQMKNEILRELSKVRGTAKHPDPPVYPMMHEVWSLLFSDYIYHSYGETTQRKKLGAWIKQYKQTGLTQSLKRQLELIIQPKAKLSPKTRVNHNAIEEYYPKAAEIQKAEYIEDIFSVEIDIAPESEFGELKEISLDAASPYDDKLFYIHFFHSLLCKILTFADDMFRDKRAFMGISNSILDNILDGERDYFFDEWYHIPDILPELLIQIAQKNHEKARTIVIEWLDSRYTFVNRLGLHCLHKLSLLDSKSITKILLANDARILKERYARRQVTPLLKSYASQFSVDVCRHIQKELLALEHDDHYDALVVVHLMALQDAKVQLLAEADARIEYLKKKLGHPNTIPTPKRTTPPSTEDDIPTLVHYLKNPPRDQNIPFQPNIPAVWDTLCKKHAPKAFEVLKLLDIEKDQTIQYWYSFLEEIGSKAQQQVEASFGKDSDSDKKDLPERIYVVTIINYWLNMAKSHQLKLLLPILDVVDASIRLLISTDRSNDQIERYMKHVMALLMQHQKDYHDYELDEDEDDILLAAINNPIGKFVELVMQYQILASPQYSDGLLPITKQFFAKILSNKQLDSSHYGLCVIARRLIDLFSYNREWTTKKLIPCFSWDNKDKARAAWSGYLWLANWTSDLIKSLDNDLIAMIDYINEVDEDCKDTFAHLIGSIALHETDILPVAKLRECVEKFNGDLLCTLLEKVKSNLEDIEEDNRSAFWQRLIKPFFKKIWPNDANKLEASMSHIFERIILMEGNAFPHAVEQLAHQWAETISKSPDYLNFYFRFVLKYLKNRNHAKNYPQATVDLLYEILGKEITLDKEQREIWEKHILVHLEPLNDKRLESIKKKLK